MSWLDLLLNIHNVPTPGTEKNLEGGTISHWYVITIARTYSMHLLVLIATGIGNHHPQAHKR